MVNTIGMVRVTCNKGEPGAAGGQYDVGPEAHQLGRIFGGCARDHLLSSDG